MTEPPWDGLLVAIVIIPPAVAALLLAVRCINSAKATMRRRGYMPPAIVAVTGGSFVAGFAIGFTLIDKSPSSVDWPWDVVTGFGGVVVAVIGSPVLMLVIARVLPHRRPRARATPVSRLLYRMAAASTIAFAILVFVILRFAAGTIAVPLLFVATFWIVFGIVKLVLSGRRAAALETLAAARTEQVETDGRRPVLYVRQFDQEHQPFVRDGEDAWTFEEFLTGAVEETIGPLVALGNPLDYLQPAGAIREYVSGGTWQERFLELANIAAAILVTPASSRHAQWELTQLRTHGLAAKMFVVFGPLSLSDSAVMRLGRRLAKWRRTEWDAFRAVMESSGYVVPVQAPPLPSVMVFDPLGRAEVFELCPAAVAPSGPSYAQDWSALLGMVSCPAAAYVYAIERHLYRRGLRDTVVAPEMPLRLVDGDATPAPPVRDREARRDISELKLLPLFFMSLIVPSIAAEISPLLSSWHAGLGWSPPFCFAVMMAVGALFGSWGLEGGLTIRGLVSGAVIGAGELAVLLLAARVLDAVGFAGVLAFDRRDHAPLAMFLPDIGAVPGIAVWFALGRIAIRNARLRRWLQAAARAAAAIIVVAVAGEVYTTARAQAIVYERTAASKLLAARALRMIRPGSFDSIDDAMAVAVMGWRLWPTEESQGAVRQVAAAADGMAAALRHHRSGVRAAVFSGDSSLLATAGPDGSLRIWNAGSWTARGPELAGHIEVGSSLRFSRDASHLLVIGTKGGIELWNLRTGEQDVDGARALSARAADNEPFVGGDVSADGRFAAMATRRGVVAWDARRRRLRQAALGPLTGIVGVHFDPDDRLLVVSAQYANGPRGLLVSALSAARWDVAADIVTSVRTPAGEEDHALPYTSDVQFTPSGNRFVTSGDFVVTLWEVDARGEIRRVAGQVPCCRAQLDASGASLFVTADRGTRQPWQRWDVASRAAVARGYLRRPGRPVWSPDGRWRAELREDAPLLIWDATRSDSTARVDPPCAGEDAAACAKSICDKLRPGLTGEWLTTVFETSDSRSAYETYRRNPGAPFCAQ